uniref:NADH deshydrogenase subunit 6 n=1 Tax=Phacomorphus fratyi TaxID=723369 RepID=A0A0S2M823_9COLE|nr:NADH dehydrogenase subunit 6 [Phacomorphus fratyi]ALO70825.1 NADH deshydrogenase subunit 6 [Phacomorphus fratyi]
MFLYLSIIINLTALFMTHPLSLGMCLLLQTIIYTMITGSITSNFWFSYILFLMMISGMLILFMYMTSIISNNKFKFSKILMITITTCFITMMFMSQYTNNLSNINFYNNLNILINNFFNTPMTFLMLILMIYLLLTLIATVKIINIKSGPLRQKF